MQSRKNPFEEPDSQPHKALSRRKFLTASTLLTVSAAIQGCKTAPPQTEPEPIIDIHQHVHYSGRPDAGLVAHQRAMGVTQTILLPAGRPLISAATHGGVSNGLQAQCQGNWACYRFAKLHGRAFLFGANEVPNLDDAVKEIERYLKRGGVIIAEQKFGVECDSPGMQKIYQLAADYRVPVLMHWQHGMYNYGFDRFYKMLEQHPRTTFIGHAQTWWANIDKNHADQAVLYPKGKVTPGGLTDRYLSDYPNVFGDLSAGSGLNALTRDEDHARDFLQRHREKLVYGSDCNDWVGRGAACQGAQMIAEVRRLAPSKTIERLLLYENAKRLFRI
jgi:predicted TIM-barrel fold metal-dependent hydrolase